MTDWLEYILKLAVSREEESEELFELPSEHPSYTARKKTPQTAYSVPQKRMQAALVTEETAFAAWEYGGIRLMQALIQGETALADSVPAAILHRQDEAESTADIAPGSEDALAVLYRRSVDAAGRIYLPGGSSGSAGQEKVVVVQESAASPMGLTAEELDRAVRRDSRRYDGGMTIY